MSTNQSFFDTIKISLFSILKNYPEHSDIIICHTDLTKKQIQDLLWISEKIRIIENNLNKDNVWPIMWHLSKKIDPRVFYARFLMRTSDVFKEYNNILHLDADTLVMNNLDNLMNFDEFYTVQEAYQWDDKIFKNHHDENLIKKLEEDKILINWEASNAWIFLLPKKYRTQLNYDYLIYLLSSYKEYIKWADQSILNIWAYKNNIPIQKEFKYNFQHRILMKEENIELIKDASIIHFNWVDSNYRPSCMKKLLNLWGNDDFLEKYKMYYNQITQK